MTRGKNKNFIDKNHEIHQGRQWELLSFGLSGGHTPGFCSRHNLFTFQMGNLDGASNTQVQGDDDDDG